MANDTNKVKEEQKEEQEKWRTIPYHPKYEASTYGNIRNAATKELVRQYRNKGYYCVTLIRNNKKVEEYVDRLVLRTFKGWKLGSEVKHLNDDNYNNNLYNLKWTKDDDKKYHITVDDLDFYCIGTDAAARKLSRYGYFSDLSLSEIKRNLNRSSEGRYLYEGIVKAEYVNEPFDAPTEYPRKNNGNKEIHAFIPIENGKICITMKGPTNLAKRLLELGLAKGSESNLAKRISETAYKRGKYQNIKFEYID